MALPPYKGDGRPKIEAHRTAEEKLRNLALQYGNGESPAQQMYAALTRGMGVARFYRDGYELKIINIEEWFDPIAPHLTALLEREMSNLKEAEL